MKYIGNAKSNKIKTVFDCGNALHVTILEKNITISPTHPKKQCTTVYF